MKTLMRKVVQALGSRKSVPVFFFLAVILTAVATSKIVTSITLVAAPLCTLFALWLLFGYKGKDTLIVALVSSTLATLTFLALVGILNRETATTPSWTITLVAGTFTLVVLVASTFVEELMAKGKQVESEPTFDGH